MLDWMVTDGYYRMQDEAYHRQECMTHLNTSTCFGVEWLRNGDLRVAGHVRRCTSWGETGF